jgi:hypothetical protein
MEKQFNPAPLFVIDYSGIKDGARIGTIDILTKDRFEPSAKWIATVMPYGTSRGNFPDHEEAKAYADLFAAAPYLLDAARYAVECLERLNTELGQIGDNGDQAYNALKAAISKAAGQPHFPVNHQ